MYNRLKPENKQEALVYLRSLIDQGEHQQLDFKFEIADSRKIARSLVAFSNTDGGTLLVGVKDNGIIAGIRTEEEVYMIEAAAELYSKPPVKFTMREWEVEGKTVLEVIIPKGFSRPHYASEKDGKWLVYVRVKDQNLLANSVLLKVWKKKEGKDGVILKYRDQEDLLLKYLELNGIITLPEFCHLAYIPRFRAEDILANFIVLDVIELILTEKGTFYRLKKQPQDD